MKKLKYLFIITIVTLFITVYPSQISQPFSTAVVSAASVKLNISNKTMYVGNTLKLKLNVGSKSLKWSTSNSKVATVSSKGIVTAISEGNATITTKYNNKKYTCKIQVKTPSISAKELTIITDQEETIKIIGANGNIQWKSNNKKVAIVDKNGTITGISPGKTKITGTYLDNKYTCTVIVEEAKITASAETVICEQQMPVLITGINMERDATFYYTIDDNSIIQCEWGKWIDSERIYLYISPLSPGETTIRITRDNYNQERLIHVTVPDTYTPNDSNDLQLSPTELYAICSESVVQVNAGSSLGSGFFYSDNTIVTNYHVIDEASSLSVQLKDGTELQVSKVLGYSESLDIALLYVKSDSPVLPINSHGVLIGETTYTIGSSLGLANTFSNGIVTNDCRIFDDVQYIQTNAAISQGNSGGPLLNAYGEVMGITTGNFTDGQNLNLAIDIKQVSLVNISEPMTTDEYLQSIADRENKKFYEDSSFSKSPETAQVLPLENMLCGSIDNNRNYLDYYRIDIKESGYYTAIYGSTDCSSVRLAIIDSNADNIVYGFKQTADNEAELAYPYLSAGTYYFVAFQSSTAVIQESVYYVFTLYKD